MAYPPMLHHGTLAIAATAVCSATASLALAGYLAQRWYKYRDRSPIERQIARVSDGHLSSQYMVLFSALIACDIYHSLAYALSFAWSETGPLPNALCRAQGAMIQSGYVASGFVTIAIALHTTLTILRRRKPSRLFLFGLISVCLLGSILFTTLPPILATSDDKGRFYGGSALWCWITPKYQWWRLVYYCWMMVSFVVCTCLAILVGCVIRRQKRADAGLELDGRRLNAIAARMTLFPVASICCMLPLAAARMMSLAGRMPPGPLFIAGAILLNLNGVVNVVIYTLSRRSYAFRLPTASISTTFSPRLSIASSMPRSPLSVRTRSSLPSPLRRCSTTPSYVDKEKVAERKVAERESLGALQWH